METKIDAGIVSAPAVQSKPRVKQSEAVTSKEATSASSVAMQPAYGFQLRVDQETKEVTVVILDRETRAVIREIPAKEMKIASDVIRNLIGPLIDKTG
jgi:uncharacterized FlaG/YvyC family protein